MKLIALMLAGASLLSAGAAAASEQITDLDYLRASRCKGIAQAMGQNDTAGLDAYLKAAGRSRSTFVTERSENEMARGKRDARGVHKAQAEAELSGSCTTYMAGPKDIAAR
jgi:hypothetical protein